MEVNKKVSLNIGKNTAVKIDTPPNYIGDIEYSVTPWIHPISKDRFSNSKSNDADIPATKAILANKINRILGATRRIKLMVRIYIYIFLSIILRLFSYKKYIRC